MFSSQSNCTPRSRTTSAGTRYDGVAANDNVVGSTENTGQFNTLTIMHHADA